MNKQVKKKKETDALRKWFSVASRIWSFKGIYLQSDPKLFHKVLLHIIPLHKLSAPAKLVEFLNMLCALFFVIPSISSLCFVSIKNFLIFKDSMKFQTSMKPSLTTLTGCNINFFKFLKLLLMWQLLSSMWHYNFLFT